MVIKMKVKQIVDARNMNISQFAEIANISYPTALAWYHGTARRVELDTLASVCYGLNVNVGDILEYIPTDESMGTKS